MAQAPIFAAAERREKVGTIFRDILATVGLQNTFDEHALDIRPEVIVEKTGNQRKLSNAILDFMFPKVQQPAELFHYTTLDGLTGIARSEELRMYALRRRVHEDEIRTFAETHKLSGCLASRKPYYEELSDDLFYTSFTRVPQSASNMWWHFSADGTGARMKVRVEPDQAELRSIQYEHQSRTLLSDLNDALAIAKEAPFIPWTISKIGAFYLPSDYSAEDEVRLLMKRHEGGRLPIQSDGRYEYLPLPIVKQNPFSKIDVLGIELGPNADVAAAMNAITGTPLDGVQITPPK